MKHFPTCLAVCFLCMLIALPFPAWAQHRPKVAVVLSGGGVKGAAHVGVLRAVEEAGLPIDYVVGTSMGAIVGGLYAMGYSTAQLDSLFRKQDWSFLLSDRPPRKQLSLAEREWAERYVLTTSTSRIGRPTQTGILRGRNLDNLLARLTVGYHQPVSFDSLTVPYACVATNLSNGQEVVFHKGIPAQAMRASMAIPGVFTAVNIDGMTLVDGGLSNNYPVDVARKMGADIVIGSTVQKALTDSAQFESVPNVLEQAISLACRNKYEENVRDCDLSLRIPVTEFSTMDFSPAVIDTALSRGYRIAKSHSAALDSLCRMVLGPAAGVPRVRPGRPFPAYENTVFRVRRISFEHIAPREAAAVGKAGRLDGTGKNSSGMVSMAQIEETLRLLHDKYLYVDANYSLVPVGEAEYDLIFRAREKSKSKVGLGARFDTEEMATVLLGADLIFNTRIPSRLSLSARLAEQYAAKVVYTVEPMVNRLFNFSYDLRHSDINVNHRGKRAYNMAWMQHCFSLAYANLRIRNFSGELGLRVLLYDVSGTPSETETAYRLKSDAYYSGYATLRYNSLDMGYYPTRGSRFEAECFYTTDNLSRFERPHGFSVLMASWESALSFSQRWALLPRISGRAVWGENVPLPFLNAYGGEQFGKYVSQQLPFSGVSHVEMAANALIICGTGLRYNLGGRHFVTALANVGVEDEKLSQIHRGRYFYGAGMRYGYNSKFGPIEATLSYSGNSEKLLFYINVGFNY